MKCRNFVLFNLTWISNVKWKGYYDCTIALLLKFAESVRIGIPSQCI